MRLERSKEQQWDRRCYEAGEELIDCCRETRPSRTLWTTGTHRNNDGQVGGRTAWMRRPTARAECRERRTSHGADLLPRPRCLHLHRAGWCPARLADRSTPFRSATSCNVWIGSLQFGGNTLSICLLESNSASESGPEDVVHFVALLASEMVLPISAASLADELALSPVIII